MAPSVTSERLRPQRIFESKIGYNYVIDFARLDLTYFEIPKTGSSSLKQFLFCVNRDAPLNLKFGLGDRNWRYLFPECIVENFKDYSPRRNKLIVMREPVSRMKSVYHYLFCRKENPEPISTFLSEYLESFIETPESKTGPNHYKPQSFFFPHQVLEDENVILCDTKNLANIPEILDKVLPVKIPNEMVFVNEGSKNRGEVDITDDEIMQMMPSIYDDDFRIYRDYILTAC